MGQDTDTREYTEKNFILFWCQQSEYKQREVQVTWYLFFLFLEVVGFMSQSTHRVAMATFWRIFHDYFGNIRRQIAFAGAGDDSSLISSNSIKSLYEYKQKAAASQQCMKKSPVSKMFSHLSPVSLTPVINLYFWKSLPIFIKTRNGPNRIGYSEAPVRPIHEKTYKWKSRDRLPLCW